MIPVNDTRDQTRFPPVLPSVGLTGGCPVLILFLLSSLVSFGAQELTPEQLMTQLQQGGCVIYLRHGQSDRTRDDAAHVDLSDCATQRVLSPAGQKQADQVGRLFQEWNIPIDQMFCSPYCRTRETAQRAFSKLQAVDALELARLSGLPSSQQSAAVAKLKERLGQKPASRKNLVLVGHQENLAAVGGPGIDEAGMAIYRPKAGGYQLLGQLNPKQWTNLVGRPRTQTTPSSSSK